MRLCRLRPRMFLQTFLQILQVRLSVVYNMWDLECAANPALDLEALPHFEQQKGLRIGIVFLTFVRSYLSSCSLILFSSNSLILEKHLCLHFDLSWGRFSHALDVMSRHLRLSLSLSLYLNIGRPIFLGAFGIWLYKSSFGILVSSIRMTWPVHLVCAQIRKASMPVILQLDNISLFLTLSSQEAIQIVRKQRIWKESRYLI